MNTHRNIKAPLTNGKARHNLRSCAETSLPRYRDRQQARDGVKALAAGNADFKMTTFKCHACLGFHLENAARLTAPTSDVLPQAHTEGRKRRYMLVDIENMFAGRIRTPKEVHAFWAAINQHAPGISVHDHVVIGASRSVAKHYRHLITGPNIKWVIGHNAADGADQALLSAINMHQVAKKFDEVVIMSGDHAFTPVAVMARKHGLSVQLVTVQSDQPRDTRAVSLKDAANTRTVVRVTPRSVANRDVARLRVVAEAVGSRAGQVLAA